MRARIALAASLTALLGLGSGQVAHAAAPSNDAAGGATPIPSLPFADVLDTSEATTDADDAALNAGCGAPVTNGSVWYTWTAPAGVGGLVVDVSESSFSAGALIAESDGQGGWTVVACGPGSTGTLVTEGSAYRVLAFSDTPGVTGGTLRLRADEAVVPTLDVIVSPKGKVDRYGNAVLSGTYTCTGGDFVFVDTFLRQPVGRFAVSGYGSFAEELTCDGTSRSWTSVIVPDNGKFAGGKAATFTFSFTCGEVFCAESYVEQTVRLSKG